MSPKARYLTYIAIPTLAGLILGSAADWLGLPDLTLSPTLIGVILGILIGNALAQQNTAS